MSDFLHAGWAWFVAVATTLSIAACVFLAWSLASRRAPTDPSGSVESTGHVWDDDLRELNNPLPRWWLYLFYLTCAFGVLYLLLYPGLGAFTGTLAWSSRSQYEAEVADANARYSPLYERYLAMPIAEVAGDADAMAMGERLFLTYCAQCHGSDAKGAPSFPDLTDRAWLGVGDEQYILSTIRNGRQGNMPAMAAAIGGTDDAVLAVANYVLSLSDSPHDASLSAAGQARFAVCGGCHGPLGQGNPVVGAPNLSDDIWLHGGSVASISETITQGRLNRMPAFGELLGDGKSHVLAAYVWSVSNADEQP